MQNFHHLIFDMDGVLWHGNSPLSDLPDFFDRLNRLGIKVVFATNNASKTRAEYVEKFKKFGVDITENQVMTAGQAAADFLAREYRPDQSKIYAIGTDSLRRMVAEKGFTLIPRFEINEPAHVVIVGYNPEVVYDDFAAATIQIRQHKARFIGTNGDLTFPSERGLIPGNGSLVALVQAATDVEPLIIGKPEPAIFQACLDQLGPQANRENTAMVGDRLSTDITGAKGVGLPSILVMSGVTSTAELDRSPLKPDITLKDIDELLVKLEAR